MGKPNKPTILMPQVIIEEEIRDKNGNLIMERKSKSHSWLKTILWILKAEFATRNGAAVGGSNENILDEGGVARAYPKHDGTSVTAYNHQLSAFGDAADVSQGLAVGSDAVANILTQYGLNTKITHGSGAGQLSYGAMTVEALTNPSGMLWQFRIIRPFTNNSGSTVTVREVGLIIKKWDASNATRNFCLIRDVLASPSAVPDGATYTLRFIFKVTVG